jgi:hypothetical protein
LKDRLLAAPRERRSRRKTWRGTSNKERGEEQKTVKKKDKKQIEEEEYLLIGDKRNGNGRDHLDIVWHQTLQCSKYTHSSSYLSQRK